MCKYNNTTRWLNLKQHPKIDLQMILQNACFEMQKTQCMQTFL